MKPRKRNFSSKDLTFTDSGRFDFETNDCTVRAIVNTCDISYDEAWLIMQKIGRKPRRGANFNIFIRLYRERFNIEELRLPPLTLNTIIPIMIKGKYIIRIKRHVFAVVDGKILDTGISPAFSKVINVWKVKGEKKNE